jgi:hypothetical protein
MLIFQDEDEITLRKRDEIVWLCQLFELRLLIRRFAQFFTNCA